MQEPTSTPAVQAIPAGAKEAQPATPPDDLFLKAVEAATAGMREEEAPPVVEAAPAPEVTPPKQEEKKAEPDAAVKLYKLLEREAAVVEREGKLKQAEAELAKLKELNNNLMQSKSRFMADPARYIKELYPEASLSDIAKALWYEDLGDNAPAEYKLSKTANIAKTEIQQLREELETERKRIAEENERMKAEVAYNQYVGAVTSFVKEVPEDLTLVKSFAQANPDAASQAMLKLATQHVQATGQVPTPEQCAKALQAELETFQKIFVPAQPKAEPVTTAMPTTLRNKYQTIQPNRRDASNGDEESKFEAAFKAAASML